ncbi:hypothetical protein A2685_00955 [Candidatus Woesebacteria bacterium RIFCSPHIGHO2_01_FULL_37_10]|uniref:Nudix hydrolase domain-containing protein n=1 Tax=Candidatus Woesebacteria bacterium RIFCSPHIGHO2_01_FULL_37_10 TaxID=1802489 RepID=A0A1F7XSK0_9BACT|nr:MAG: hypothetical protein A2685_00955 [Candidatus Woesebacteria bacterium RIFCSPHIGHO2_01_FULL_37_10]
MANSIIDHEIQRQILHKSRFIKSGAKYSQLKIENVENDLFNYHLQQLVKKDLLKKSGTVYLLTSEGKAIVTNIDEEDLKNPPNFKVSVYMCLLDKNKVLLYERRKHPQYGYVGFPSGKIRFGENLLDTAKRELFEETGLKADFKLIGNIRQIRKNKSEEILEDGLFYICFSDSFNGNFESQGKEGRFFWQELDDINSIKKLFKPSVGIITGELRKRINGEAGFDTQFIYELEPGFEEY